MCDECKGKALQTKLAIGSVNDPLEREADRVADQVMASSAPAALGGGAERGAHPAICRY